MSSNVDSIFEILKDIASNPAKAIEAHKKETGKGSIGILPVYAPEEIVHATGSLPVGIWGGKKLISKARTFLPPYTCSIMQTIMELELEGTYDDLEAIIISSPCDTLKCIGQKWKGKSPVIQFVHPQNRDLEEANEYLTEEYKEVRAKLENILGEKITDEEIEKSIVIYNENRRAMRDFVEIAAKYPSIVDASRRHAVMKSRFFMDKAKHTKLVNSLIKEINELEPELWNGKKIILTGIMAEPNELLEIFTEFGFAVVADDLAQESRQFRVDVPEGDEEPLYRLAKAWQNMYGCSLATDREKGRIPMLLDMADKYEADALIMCMMKFCDPEGFDYPLIYEAFESKGKKTLFIDVDMESSSFEKIKTRIQSLMESL